MTVADALIPTVAAESFERHLAVLFSAQVIEKIASLSIQAREDFLALWEEFQNTTDIEDKKEILSAMVEIALNESVKTSALQDVEKEARSTLAGAAAAERFQQESRTFARNLKDLRKNKRLTQAQLAASADMTQPQISYLERGEHRPQETTAKKLAEALGVPLEELVPV